jgi:D-aspartate ligase
LNSPVDFESVLLGGDANAYGMARSFYEEYGVRSHAIGKGAFHICQNSKIVSFEVAEPNIEDDEVFVRTLVNFAKTRPAGKTLVLSPCGDNYTKMLVRNQDALRDYYRFSIMTPDQFDLLSTKDRFYGTCVKYGLEFPKTCEVTKETAEGFEPPTASRTGTAIIRARRRSSSCATPTSWRGFCAACTRPATTTRSSCRTSCPATTRACAS